MAEILTSKVLHENKSQGVLYEFTRGARVWRNRQKRGLCVGGDLNGQRLTQEEIRTSKWPNSYLHYNKANAKYVEPFVWVYIPQD